MSHGEEDIDHLIDEELVDYVTTENDKLRDDYSAVGDHGASIGQAAEIMQRATIPTADATVNTLRAHIMHYDGFPMKYAQHGSAFTHCSASVSIAEEYSRLRRLLAEHARLQLQKDMNNRIHQFEIFIRNLKKLVQEETASWQAINHSKEGELENHQTNLTALSSICDEFRMHLNHWICIKHRVQNNKWLRSMLPSFIVVMHKMCDRFVRLQETAFWWTEKLLKTGMQVFAYVDRRSLTYNDVFSIVRGIEEYNTLIQLVRLNTYEMRLSSQELHSFQDEPSSRKRGFNLIQHCHSAAIDSSTTKSLHFLRLLHSLAFEWAKSAVAMTRHFFDNQGDLLSTMQSKPCLHVDEPSISSSRATPVGTDPSSVSPVPNTSDYFSESLNNSKRDQTTCVNITSTASPLLDFGKKEKEYISKVIQITCQRTTLLRKNKYAGSLHGVSSAYNSSPTKKPQSKGLGDESVISEDQTESFIRSDSKRKSVSWGDSHDMSVCRQLIAKYNDALWKAFGTKLEDSLNYELDWSRPGGHKSNIGCLDLCSSGAIQTFVESVDHAASKGYFTNSGSKQISQVLSLLRARTSLTCCDIAISKCLSSMQSGRADAIPLHDGRKSTRTAMLLRNAVRLARPRPVSCPAGSESLAMSKGSPSHHSYVSYRILASAVSKLETIIALAEKWCLGKAKLFLHSYKVAPFVVITHGDLVIIHKELLSAIRSLQEDVFVEKVKAMEQRLERLALFHVEMKEKLSEKARGLSAEILSDQIPRPKTWRQSLKEEELQVQGYAESLVDGVLMPVADGAKHLCADDQAVAIDTVVNAICQTWLQYFLKRKIKFSLQGTAQLRKDFSYLSDFIDIYLNDDSVKTRILQSPEIHRFYTVIRILADQPSSSKRSITESHSSRNKVAAMERLDSPSQPDYNITDKSQWVALRAGKPVIGVIFPCLPPKLIDGC